MHDGPAMVVVKYFSNTLLIFRKILKIQNKTLSLTMSSSETPGPPRQHFIIFIQKCSKTVPQRVGPICSRSHTSHLSGQVDQCSMSDGREGSIGLR